MTPRLPRNVSGRQLASALSIFGYRVTRQSGSHQRLTTAINGEHHITIPVHDPLKLGTLSAILSEVSRHLGISKAELIEKLFQ
jgi:predicted RNA binding protein YcfA (HicA-like mRNA interferase family)